MKFITFFSKIKNVLGLSMSMAKANFKLRNEGTYLGILWYLLEPLSFFFIILKIRGVLNTNIPSYPVYLFFGLIMFNLFSKITNTATTIIQSNKGFIKSLKIRYESFVIAIILQMLFSHFFELVALVVIMVFYKVPLINMIFYPAILLLYSFFILGISLVLAVAGVYIKDLSNIWRIITMLLWFVSPIFYFIKEVGLNIFNPFYHFMTFAREIIIYGTFNSFLLSLIILIVISFTSFFVGFWVFEKFKYKLAEQL